MYKRQAYQGTFVGTEQALNSRGQITGSYADANSVNHGYVRRANGTYQEFDAPNAGTQSTAGTVASSLNVMGTAVGIVYDSSFQAHGFVRTSAGAMILADAPGKGNLGTFPHAVNSWNLFAGFYADPAGNSHGFIAQIGAPDF